MGDTDSRDKDSITEVASDEPFVRERPPEIERGTVLAGRYQVEDVIGKGGSGIVLRVFDRTAQNLVALKVLKSELARDAKWEKRFSRELRLGRPLQHPNVCRIFDIGEADGYRFLTMELASGGSLREELRKTRALDRPIEGRLADARAAIEGLAAIHAAGVVHRDFKPDNLLRMADGRLVISDFGLATDAATAPGVTVLIGTPHYMAPEVLSGDPATSRSDVWALGVVLHEIFFGQRPERRSVSFDGSGKGPLRPTSTIERAMLALCERCTVEMPLDRPADAGAVVREFNAVLKGRRLKPSARRFPVLGVAVLAIVVVAFGFAGIHRRSETKTVLLHNRNDRLSPIGEAADWSKRTRLIADLPGHVHCFSMLAPNSARVIWGGPRHAEDVDLISGHRRATMLDPESYRFGCPELSPSGQQVLFTGQNQAGVSEIHLSSSPDGKAARVITSGADPEWIGDDEFVYEVDSSHEALFSIPAMSFTLLPDPGFGSHRIILDKAISQERNAIALLICDESSNYAVAVYDGKEFEKVKTFPIPAVHRIQFGWDSNVLLVSYQLSGTVSTLGALYWREGVLRNLGRAPGFDIVRARLSNSEGLPGDLLLTRHVSSDLWYDDGVRRQRLSTDGQTYSGDRSPSGDLLLSKWNSDGSVNVWWVGVAGQIKNLTHGQSDVEPCFSPDGHHWLYADYAKKSIMFCSFDDGKCKVLSEDALPSSLTFSPDGKNVAYLVQVGSPKLKVISTKDGAQRATWDAVIQCPPAWTSESRIWTLETSEGRYAWAERDIATGGKTGNRSVEKKMDPALEIQCPVTRESPFSRHVRIEHSEVSKILAFE
ncbi:MAG TPA: WD40 repeat domain-containing serine/threonine protein kinase [Polyangia bacterium]|nr:WD40 repeat domain-containing serine/threonine protein kinase [Polyangia bacterium]